MQEELGYRRFGAQGGDWGAFITARLGQAHPDKLIGIHLNMVPVSAVPGQRKMSEEELQWLDQQQHWRSNETGYSMLQRTRPQTLAYGLNDSPVGLAAWIIEKFRAWSDCQGEIERVFSKDELLTNIVIYWVTATINSSTRLYYETFHQGANQLRGRIDVPTGVAMFPREITTPPRSIVQAQYNVQRWTPMERGGHFAALEQPEALVDDVRAFFRPHREGL